VASALLLAAACGDGGSPGPEDVAEPPPTGAEVSIVDFAFEPDSVAVKAGEVVAFTNDGDTTHTVTGDDVDSGRQEPGDTFRYVTDDVAEPTTVEYHCSIHPGMRGEIVIEPDEPAERTD
jgi:plastocyanin